MKNNRIFSFSSSFFLSIFICVTMLLWKNCKSPLSSSPTKNNNTNTTKNDIDDPHHDYINVKSRNNNKNMIFINHNNSNYDNQSFVSDVTCSRSEFIYYSNDNNNINIDESNSTYITAHTTTNNRYSETLSSRQNKDNSKLGNRDSPTIMTPRGQRFTTILSCRGVLICIPNGQYQLRLL